MSKIRLHGSSSGHTEVAAAAAAGNNTITLPTSAGEVLLNDGSAASLTQIPAANIVGVATAGLRRTNESPLQVLEQFHLLCDGRSVTTAKGTVTTTDVTAVQNATDAHATLTGSSISYLPPDGTTEVIYEFFTAVQEANTNNRFLSTFAVQIDGTTIEESKDNIFLAASQYLGHLKVKFPIRIKSSGSDDNDTGDRAGWSSAKTISVIANRYASSYAMQFHALRDWGTTGTTGDDILKKPYVGITAIGQLS